MLVAKADIGLGHTVSGRRSAWQTWPAAAAGRNLHPQKPSGPEAIEESVGVDRARAVLAGEPIREAKLIKANGGPASWRRFCRPACARSRPNISPETGAGGFILPNDHVDVILTRRDKHAEKSSGVEIHVSEIILTNVRVLAIDQTVEEKNGQRVVVGKTATLEVTPSQAETLTLSQQLGTLVAGAAQPCECRARTSRQPGGRRRRRAAVVNIVRFGVTTMTTTTLSEEGMQRQNGGTRR